MAARAPAEQGNVRRIWYCVELTFGTRCQSRALLWASLLLTSVQDIRLNKF
ncbi:MAG: hypothetical protein WBA89_13320 [Microcoleus sp.]|uniref:hypothetical protein n=1 Tax=Microcoleus sp. TaxID=44472 RepID=UPI003C71FB8E